MEYNKCFWSELPTPPLKVGEILAISSRFLKLTYPTFNDEFFSDLGDINVHLF